MKVKKKHFPNTEYSFIVLIRKSCVYLVIYTKSFYPTYWIGLRKIGFRSSFRKDLLQTRKYKIFLISKHSNRLSQWPRGLKRRSAAVHLMRMWVRIQPGAWMSLCYECCVLSGRGHCVELITRPEESYRLWCVVVCDVETSWMGRPWPPLGPVTSVLHVSAVKQPASGQCRTYTRYNISVHSMGSHIVYAKG